MLAQQDNGQRYPTRLCTAGAFGEEETAFALTENILARRHLWYAAGPTLSCLPLRQARREWHGRRGRQNCSVKGYGFAEGVCGFCRGLPSVIFTACYEAGQSTFPKQSGSFLDCLCAQSSTLSDSLQVIYFTSAIFPLTISPQQRNTKIFKYRMLQNCLLLAAGKGTNNAPARAHCRGCHTKRPGCFTTAGST